MPLVIVYGALRSGSTLLRLMINGHSQLSCTGEHDYLFDHVHQHGESWSYDLEELQNDRIFRAHGFSGPNTKDGTPALAKLLEEISQQGGAEISVLMLHRGLEKALQMLPEARVIHLLRDPRDVARSWVGMGWQGNAYRAVDGWMKTEADWHDATQKFKVSSLELKYEDLVTDADAELGRVCDFLDIAFETDMLGYPAHSTYSKPDARLAEQWRKKMPPKDLRLVEARLGAMLTESNYEPSGQPPLTITTAQRVLLDIQSAYGRWKHLTGRYGFLPIQRGLGRRLGLKSLEKEAQRKIDVIMTERYLK